MLAIGLMSGTSLDGIDAALLDVVPQPRGYTLRTRRFATEPFAAEFAAQLRSALPPNEPSPAVTTALDAAFGAELARVAKRVAGDTRVDFVASHGLTLYHRGESALTAQIGSPYALRDALDATVVYDFRRADCARGGHGAPLVPYFDALVFGSEHEDVVALNLGGIANLTVVPRGAASDAFGFDAGPGNMLLDAFVSERTRGEKTFDDGGTFALRGQPVTTALAGLLDAAADFLNAPPPKSTGRERFGADFLRAQAPAFGTLSLEDGCATLAAFTVEAVARALEAYGPKAGRVIVSGGGASNIALLRGLARRIAPRGFTVVTSDAVGIDPDAKEAIAFALLGYETLRGRPANLPRVTGAAQPVVLGSIVPHRLGALLEKMRTELAAHGAIP